MIVYRCDHAREKLSIACPRPTIRSPATSSRNIRRIPSTKSPSRTRTEVSIATSLPVAVQASLKERRSASATDCRSRSSPGGWILNRHTLAPYARAKRLAASNTCSSPEPIPTAHRIERYPLNKVAVGSGLCTLVHTGQAISCRTFVVTEPISRRRNLPNPFVGITMRSVFSHFATHSITVAGSPSSILWAWSIPEKWATAKASRRRSC